MPLHKMSFYTYFASWIFLAIFPYVYFTNYIYEPVLAYLTGTSLYYAFYALTNYKLPAYFKALTALIIFLSLYGLFLILIGDEIYWVSTGNYVRKYLYILWLIPSLLSVFPVYVFSCKGLLKDKEIKVLFFILFGCCIYAFYGALKIQILNAALQKTGQEEYTITSVYSFLSIMPLVLLFKKKEFLQIIFLSVMFVYLVLSAKRGAVMLGGAGIMVIILNMFVRNSFGKKLFIALGTVCLLIGIYTFVNHKIESSAYFAARVEQTKDGYTSKREDYAHIILDHYSTKTNIAEFFFGIGAQGTLSINESFAHNDWLAILLEQGLLGLFLYACYWCSFICTWIQSRSNPDAFVAIGVLIIVGFGKTLFSMYYLPISAEMMTSSGFFTIALGYYLSKAFPQQEAAILYLPQKANG